MQTEHTHRSHENRVSQIQPQIRDTHFISRCDVVRK